mgnify:CR=1 FL=1
MRISKAIVTVFGALFAALGLGFWLAPERLAQRFDLQALGVAGLSTLRADMGGAFLTLAALCLAGAWLKRRALLLAAAAVLGLIVVGRLLAFAITGNAAVFIGGGAASNAYGTVVLNPTTSGANTYAGGTTIGTNTSYVAVEVPAIASPFSVFGSGPLTFASVNAPFRLAAALPNADADLSSAANLTSIVINGGAKFDTNRAADGDTVVFARGIGAYGATGAFQKQGRGILRFDGINTYLGNTEVIGRTTGNGVSALHLNNANPFNAGYAVNGAAAQTQLYFNPHSSGTNNDLVGSAVQLLRNVSLPALHAPGVGTTVVAPVGSVVNLGGFDLTLTGGGSTQFAGTINGGIGALGTLGLGSLIKVGGATFTMQSANSGNYSGKTIVRGGTLQLNFNALNVAPASMINSGSSLELGEIGRAHV